MAHLFSKAFLTQRVTPKYADLGLLVCALATGVVDSVAFENWGVFVGMQTGECLSFAY